MLLSALFMEKIYRIFNPRIAVGTIILLLLLAGGASAISDNETQAFLSLINNHRTQNNLGTLSIDESLQAAADWMSNDMLHNCVTGKSACSHTDSTGRTFDKRLLDFGYPVGISAAGGENIAWGYGLTTAQQAFTAWKNSPGHNTNMLGSSYTAIGISRSCSADNCAWVTDFGSKVVQPGTSLTSTPTSAPTPKITIIPTPIPEKGSISGYIINDVNGNARWDRGEKGLSGWNISLIGSSKDGIAIRKRVSTDAVGLYMFNNLSEGRYFVIERRKKGSVPTSSNVKAILLVSGKASTNNNFTVR